MFNYLLFKEILKAKFIIEINKFFTQLYNCNKSTTQRLADKWTYSITGHSTADWEHIEVAVGTEEKD